MEQLFCKQQHTSFSIHNKVEHVTSSNSYILKLPSHSIVQRIYVHDFIYGDASMEAKLRYCAFVVTYYKTHITLKLVVLHVQWFFENHESYLKYVV